MARRPFRATILYRPPFKRCRGARKVADSTRAFEYDGGVHRPVQLFNACVYRSRRGLPSRRVRRGVDALWARVIGAAGHTVVQRQLGGAQKWHAGATPALARASAYASIALWLIVLVAGRLIAFAPLN